MSEPALELRGVRKQYGTTVAVDDLSLTVQPAELLTLLGASGSGKTTTLMMIAGFEMPTAGEMFLLGSPITDTPPHRRGVGMVFQNYALFPHMTVYENVAFPLWMRRTSRAEIDRRVRETLELVQLGAFGARSPRQLSGGQQQRVALARALVFRPPILLMDEPLGALDRRLRQQMQLEIRRLQRSLDLTIVYVTHDQEEALTMSDRIAIMHHGRIVQIGTPSGVYYQPATPFVAEFLGEMNFLEGKIEANEASGAVMRSTEGLEVRTGPLDRVVPGQLVRAAVRPERLVVTSPASARDPALNHADGTLEDVIFLGEALKVLLRTDGGGRLVVRMRNLDGEALGAARSRVRVAWRIQDTLVFPAA